MPIDGWDHLELYVGNAKQAAFYYENAFGFTKTAYAGPETGVRDRASYLLEQGDIRFVLTSGLRADERQACTRGRAEGDRPRGRQRGARPDGLLGRVLRAHDGLHEHHPLRGRTDTHRVLGADVEGDGRRPGEDQVPDQRAGRGEAQKPDRGVPRLLRRPRGPARRAAVGG